VTTQAKYQVKAPTGSALNGTPGSVSVVVTKTQARLVTSGATKGMVWHFSATSPANGSGMLNATQVINACRTLVISGTTEYKSINTNGKFYLDNVELYADTSTTIAAGASATWTDSDSPSSSAPLTASSIAANDTFNTTFLYKPDGVGMGSGNGVWVPLGVFKWGWTASAQNVNGTWMLGSGSKISNLGTAAPSYPSWSGVLTNGSGYSATPNC
jgi:hypothetical protein